MQTKEQYNAYMKGYMKKYRQRKAYKFYAAAYMKNYRERKAQRKDFSDTKPINNESN